MCQSSYIVSFIFYVLKLLLVYRLKNSEADYHGYEKLHFMFLSVRCLVHFIDSVLQLKKSQSLL